MVAHAGKDCKRECKPLKLVYNVCDYLTFIHIENQQLEKEIRDGSWIAASVSKEVLFKSRDRLGAKRAKPLWTEIMELLGGEYKDIRDKLYDDQ